MKYLIAILFAALALYAEAQLSFEGAAYAPVEVRPEASTGLDGIYVLDATSGVTASYPSASARWYRYGNLGGGYAEEVPSAVDGNVSKVRLGADDMGYIIEDGTSRHYYWLVNYDNHRAAFTRLDMAPEQDCDRARLEFTGDAGRITYYTINGQGRELSRELTLSYNTLEYDESSMQFVQKEAEEILSSVDASIGVPAPLCDTRFTLRGDRFLRAWGMEEQIESPWVTARAVDARSWAEQSVRDNDNEQKVEGEALGGSAPVDVSFHAAVTDAAIFREWQMTSDPTFEVVDDRFQQLDFDYSFRDMGTVYVRFMCANSDGSCEYYGDTFEVFVGESALLCPNAFSPGSSEGVNDEWKVSYKSIVSFECHIFNRWGQEMTSFKNPADGWDGKYKGKYVPAGVYYYVIQAKGADGKDYKLAGDINIVKSKMRSSSGSPSETE